MKDNLKGGNMKKYLFSLASIALIFSACSNKNLVYNEGQEDENVVVIEDKTNINKKDFISEISLHDAVRARDLNQVKFLLSKDSDVNEKDIYGYTPLHLAVRLNELEILNELIKNKASVNSEDVYMDTPLLDSTRNDYTNISEVLICNGAYRNVSDSHNMTPLHNSSKNKNLFISKMLLADDLTPYCKELGNKIIDLDIVNSQYRVCGNYQNNVEATNVLNVKSYTGELVDSVDSVSLWCSDFDKLENGRYTLEANAQDIYKRKATDEANLDVKDDLILMYKSDLKISIDDIDNFDDKTKLICGDIEVGKTEVLTLDLYNIQTNEHHGKYETFIKDNRWCSKVDDITYGAYLAKAKGTDKDGNVSVAVDERINYKEPEPEVVDRFIGLYDALNEEFEDDFGPWNAELTKDLTFRFKDPASLFAHGDSDLKQRFTNILSDFFPRYLKIVSDYQEEIKEVAIEGHTSSSYRLAKNDKERYNYNKVLSQKRANEVREYSIEVAKKSVDIDQNWIANTFKPYGKSYDNLIFNLDGTENAAESRRVEFNIVRKENTKPVMKKIVE